jgi:hypothetical protein
MDYDDWLTSVPSDLTDDPLWRMEVFRFAVFASDLAGMTRPGWLRTNVP